VPPFIACSITSSLFPPLPHPRSTLGRPDATALPYRSGTIAPFLADLTLGLAISCVRGSLGHLLLSPMQAPMDVVASPASGCVRRCGSLPSSRLPARIQHRQAAMVASLHLLYVSCLLPLVLHQMLGGAIASMQDDKLLKALTS
jgi:hypothetical protein